MTYNKNDDFRSSSIDKNGDDLMKFTKFMISKTKKLPSGQKIAALAVLLAALLLCSCGAGEKRKVNNADLNLDIGIGFSHFDNESDYPEPSENAYLDVYSSKIIIRDAYDDKQIIETPLIYNNSSTAHPRKLLVTKGNRMYVIYCPDISMPGLQIASTDDGGGTWTQSTLSLDADTVGTIDNFSASFWATKSGALIIANGMVDTFIYMTDDAGKTWVRAEGAPPSQNWHDSMRTGIFLSNNIGFVTYNYYSFSPSEPQVYVTLDGSKSWSKLAIKVPSSVMEAYSVAGTPFYDGNKINIPIEIYSDNDELANTVYYVSFDLGVTWQFYVDDADTLDSIRAEAAKAWFETERPSALSELEFDLSDLSLYSSFNIDEDVRIDAYKLVAKYNIGEKEMRSLHLTPNMYFDKDANLVYRTSDGYPILMFVYEGDVFSYTYSLLGSSTEKHYENEGEDHLAKRLYDDYVEIRSIKELFAAACEAYSWFTGYASGLEIGEGTLEHGGVTYEAVNAKDITSVAMLRDYLETLFETEIVDKLMSTYVDTSETPLFVDGDDGLYRYGGYTALSGYDSIATTLSVSELGSSHSTLTVSADSVLYETEIKFSYDCKVTRSNTGEWIFESFTFPANEVSRILNTESETIEEDKTEETIYDIRDWSMLKYTGDGAGQIRNFLEALISGNSFKLAQCSSASEKAVFEEYENIVFSEYEISKKYIDGHSRIIFTYTIEEPPKKSVPRTEKGTHSLYVSTIGGGVCLTSTTSAYSSGAAKLLSDYFSSTLDYAILDCSDLSYSGNYDITEFAVKRLGGSGVSADEIKKFVRDCFGESDFTPSSDLLGEDGLYSVISRGTRKIDFDILSETESDGEVSLTVQLYADASRLIPARTVEFKLQTTLSGLGFKSSYTSATSTYKVYKINEQK